MADPCIEEARIERNESDIQDLWKSLEALKKGYVPLWATVVFGLMCSAITLLATLLVSK